MAVGAKWGVFRGRFALHNVDEASMKLRLRIAALLLFALAAAPVYASLSLSSLATYTQDFNFLANVGPDPVSWTDNQGSTDTHGTPGWYWQTDGNVAGYRTVNSTSSGAPGGRFSFLNNPNTDKAMGSFNKAVDNPNAAWGVVFQNNTGSTIRSITVGYTGEQWRQGGSSGTPDKLSFSYVSSATDITNYAPGSGATLSGWSNFSPLDFTELQFLNTNFTIDGNAAANRTVISGVVINVTVPSGQYLALRWFDGDNPGLNDGGMSTDDLSVAFSTAAVPEPSALLFGGLICGLVGFASLGAEGPSPV